MALTGKALIPELILIPDGNFLMGSENGLDVEKPVHRVWLDAFMIGRFPVTNREYQKFVEEKGVTKPPFWSEDMFCHTDKPVVGTTWYDAVAYCKWLSQTTGKRFRLPTEAEWERAARGGFDEKNYPWGNAHPSARPFPGYDPQKGGPERVGLYEPNGFGIYDMAGGVHEWLSDYYDPLYYKDSPDRNPRGPASGKRRASRGGSWRHRIKFSRCAARSSLNPISKYADYGFRVAISL